MSWFQPQVTINISSMRTFSASTIYVGIFTLTTLLSSCSNSGRKDRPVDDGEGHPPSLNQPREDYGAGDPATDFVREALSDGLMEVQMADLALERAEHSQVKELAQKIRQDHQAANQQLKELVRTNNWGIPSEMMDKHKEKIERLKQPDPGIFDEQYVEMLIADHQEAIDKFEKTAAKLPTGTASEEGDQSAEDLQPSLTNWINNTLPVLREHLERSKEVLDELPKTNTL